MVGNEVWELATLTKSIWSSPARGGGFAHPHSPPSYVQSPEVGGEAWVGSAEEKTVYDLGGRNLAFKMYRTTGAKGNVFIYK